MGCEQEPGGRGNHQRPGKSIIEMISSQGREDCRKDHQPRFNQSITGVTGRED